jgi:adenylate cyclase
MRIGIRFALSGLVLASIVVSAAGVHLLWWRTAQQISEKLADTINDQIVSAVGDELQSITSEAKSAFAAVRTLLIEKVVDSGDAGKRQFVFLSQLQAQPTISWVAFGFPDGSFSGAHKLGESAIEMLDINGAEKRLRSERYDYAGMDVKFAEQYFANTNYSVADQQWYRESIQASDDDWFKLTTHPGGERPAVALAGPIDIDQKRIGVLAIIIELTRVSNFLSQLTVGKSAGAFILERDGTAVASPDADADELTAVKTSHPLFSVAVAAMRQAGSAYDSDKAEAFHTQVSRDGKGYEVVLTPISFPGWSLVTVVPESEFLGPVQSTIRNLLLGLAVLIVIAGLLSAWIGQRLIAAPLIKVVNEVRHVERFDLDRVERHSSRLAEIENLSSAIADMALGLAAFRKYIPADERDVRRHGRFHQNVGTIGRPHHPATLALLRRGVDGGTRPRRHHRQVHRRRCDGVLGCAGVKSRTCARLLPRGAGLPEGDPRTGSARRRAAARGNPYRHQFRRHAGRQYRLRSPAQLHGHWRCRERREPSGEHEQGIRHPHHHRPGNPAAGGRSYRCA